MAHKRANRVPPQSAFKRSSERRRALALLAASPDGSTEALLLAHGFSTEMIVELIRDGFANAQTERVMASGRAIEVTRVRITDAGRRALAERAK
jgi:hypothetical protein